MAIKVARRVGPHIARERDALAKLRDKHADAGQWVVELVDSGQTEDGRDFIVLNWYSCSLEDWLEKPSSFAVRMQVLEQCAEVVTRLHRAADLRERYLHRDIKPGNFLIDESESPPRVVLADLGGVKDGRMLATTQFEGLHSPGFAPAEQGLPLAQRPDPSLDVIVRLGHATSYTLSPTNREVAFDVPNGDSTITVESKDTRKAIRGCVWDVRVSDGQIAVNGDAQQTVANGSAHRLECKAP